MNTTLDKKYNTAEAKEEAKESHSFSATDPEDGSSQKYTIREANDGQLFSTPRGFRFCVMNHAGEIVAQTDSRAHAEAFEKALEQDTKKEDKKIHRAA